jgi:hypothetical protein
MKPSVLIAITLLCAGCANMNSPSAQDQAARNRCEALRSYEPYYPGGCGETSGGARGAMR